MRKNSNPALLLKPRVYRSDTPAPRYLSYHGANLQEKGTRPYQEDSYAFANISDVTLMKQRGLLAVVADGMGGMKDGKAASEAAIATITADFEKMDMNADIPAQICDSIRRANNAIFASLGAQGGSTGIVCVFFRESLYFASVGDSYLILKRGDELYHLNRKQNMFTRHCLLQLRSGEVDPTPALNNPEKAALTGYLGMQELSDIDFVRRPIPLMDGDVILICSDGVGGVLSEAYLLAALSEPTPAEMCRMINQGVVTAARRYQDNYTALVIRCER